MLPPRAAPRPIGGGAWIPGPQALQPPQPRDISASNRAPGLALRSRERELGGPGRELKIKGGSRPGLGGCTHTRLQSWRIVEHTEYSPPLPFLIISSSQFCNCPDFPVHCTIILLQHSPMCGQNWDFERICEPSLFLQLDFGQSGRSDLSQKMRNVNGSAVTRAFPWRKYWLLTLKLLDPTSI